MDIQKIFWLTVAALFFIGGPIAMIWTFVDGMRRKASDRPSGGGSMSNAIGSAMQEIDRLITRPSIEHQIETEHQTLEREDDKGGD